MSRKEHILGCSQVGVPLQCHALTGMSGEDHIVHFSQDKWDDLVAGADPKVVAQKELFYAIGRHCHSVEKAYTSLRDLVIQLRNFGIYLLDYSSIQVAKSFILETYCSAYIDKYMNNLRQLLLMPEEQIPLKPCITGSNSFWIAVGVEVDCFTIQPGKQVGSGSKEWWHGVVLNFTDCAKLVPVFLVGFEPLENVGSRSKKLSNPMFVHRNMVRGHLIDGKEGPNSEYSVAWICQNRISRKFATIDAWPDSDLSEPRLKSTIEAGVPVNNESQHQVGEKLAAETNDPSRFVVFLDDANDVTTVRRPHDCGNENQEHTQLGSRVDKGLRPRQPDPQTTVTTSAVTTESVTKSKGRKQGTKATEAHKARVKDDAAVRAAAKNAAAASAPPFKSGFCHEVFSLDDDVQYAISSLMALQEPNVTDHVLLQKNLTEGLLRVAKGLGAVYKTSSYVEMVNDTLRDLGSYPGPENPQLPHSKEFLRLLRHFGFCISPRMFSVSEILCIATALLDARHRFLSIGQKSKNNSGFRGMAMLDSRVQVLFYKRLQKYGFADPWFHPPDLQSYSSVVINGGGSFLQASNWDYEHQSRFQIDVVVSPFAIQVSDSPGLFEANGLYVASTLRMNGKPVYAQVSEVELKKFGLISCLKPEVVSKWEEAALDSKGLREEVCSPRVLVFDGDQWVIKVLPAIHTSMCLLRFNWDAIEGIDINDAQCLKCASLYGTFEMQRCNLKLQILFNFSSDCLQNTNVTHNFSFGCKKYVYNNSSRFMPDGRAPGPLWPQGFHGDGPRLFDTRVFDLLGNFQKSACSCAELKEVAPHKGQKRKVETEFNSWCPFFPCMLQPYFENQNDILSESWSALGGVFRGTYIETVRNSRNRLDKKKALKVPVPLGCMILFTFYWLHRGKGDEVTKLDPAPVHARPHFYVYSREMCKMPTYDVEALLEFIGICTDKHSSDDSASKLHALETLQTFTPMTSYGHAEMKSLPPVHQYFDSQDDLDNWIQRARTYQSVPKQKAATRIFVGVSKWHLKLSYEVGQAKVVRLLGSVNSGNVEVTVREANFATTYPQFYGDDGKAYHLEGPHMEGLCFRDVANTPDSVVEPSLFHCEFFTNMINDAFSKLLKHWCPVSLLYLMCLLDTRVIKNAALFRGAFDVLHAKTATETIPLLSSFELVQDTLHGLCTSRLDLRRILVHVQDQEMSFSDQYDAAKIPPEKRKRSRQ